MHCVQMFNLRSLLRYQKYSSHCLFLFMMLYLWLFDDAANSSDYITVRDVESIYDTLRGILYIRDVSGIGFIPVFR